MRGIAARMLRCRPSVWTVAESALGIKATGHGYPPCESIGWAATSARPGNFGDVCCQENIKETANIVIAIFSLFLRSALTNSQVR
jgi:hypothetical protein